MTLTVCLLAAAQVVVETVPEGARVRVGKEPFTTFYIREGAKPYLHPLRAASGKVVTRAWPMADAQPADKRDHPHHKGLWFSHGDVNGWDFWANEVGQKGVGKGSGRIGTKSVQARGPAIRAELEWRDGEGRKLLDENRTMEFGAAAATRSIDFDITLTAAEAVVFGDTKEGTFALRLRDEFTEKGGGTMRNAEGRAGEREIWGKPARWVQYEAMVDGAPVAVTILDSPENPRHPTTWHARAYGLFAANIFGLHDFYNDPKRDGAFRLKAGERLRFRYRVLIQEANFSPAAIEREAERFRTGSGSAPK